MHVTSYRHSIHGSLWFLVLLMSLVSCERGPQESPPEKPRESPKTGDDPGTDDPESPSSDDVDPDPTTQATASPDRGRAFFAGHIIELATFETAAELTAVSGRARCRTRDGDDVFLVDRERSLLRVDLEAAEIVWSASDVGCDEIFVDEGHVDVFSGTELLRFDRDDGGRLDMLDSGGEAPLRDVARLGDAYVVLLASGDTPLVDADTLELKKKVSAPPGESVRKGAVNSQLVVPGEAGFCNVVTEADDLVIGCFDTNGDARFVRPLPHSHVEVKGNTHHSTPNLRLADVYPGHLLLTSPWFGRKYPRTYVLAVDDGRTIVERDAITTALAVRSDGTLEGLVDLNEESDAVRFLEPTDGTPVRWEGRVGSSHDEGATVALAGDVVLVARYSPIATGSALAAFDLESGKRLWVADVEQLMVGHSEYWNRVELEVRDARVLMWGHEAYGGYLQIFELETGVKKYARLVTDP